MKERRQPETLRLRSLMPALTVNDLTASVAWYRDVLGFIVAEEFRREDRVVGVRLTAGTVDFLLGQDDFAKGRDRKKGEGIRLYFQTKETVDDLAARVKAAGVAIASEPADQPWGGRTFDVVDPDGYKHTVTSTW